MFEFDFSDCRWGACVARSTSAVRILARYFVVWRRALGSQFDSSYAFDIFYCFRRLSLDGSVTCWIRTSELDHFIEINSVQVTSDPNLNCGRSGRYLVSCLDVVCGSIVVIPPAPILSTIQPWHCQLTRRFIGLVWDVVGILNDLVESEVIAAESALFLYSSDSFDA